MFDLSLQQLLLRIVGIIVISAVHGFFVALFARLLGDKGPVHDERLTLNPFAHLDLLAVVAAIFSQFGWIRPVAVETRALRGGVVGQIAVALLALAATLGLAWLVWSFRSIVISVVTDASMATGIIVGMRITVEMTVWFVVLNIIPIPPLTMGNVVAGHPRIADFVTRSDIVVRLALVVLAATGVLTTLLRPLAAPLQAAMGLG